MSFFKTNPLVLSKAKTNYAPTMHTEDAYGSKAPVPEKALRDLAKGVGKFLPNLAEKDPTNGVK